MANYNIQNSSFIKAYNSGGFRGMHLACTPLQTKISLISKGFSENITKILGRPPTAFGAPLLGEVLDPSLYNDGPFKFEEFHATKRAITPQNMLQMLNSPIITHLISGFQGQRVTTKCE